MLDGEHEDFDHTANDTNIYTLGHIGEHHVVITCLPEGQTGTNSAAAVAVQMKSAFTSIRVGLMVGIGGGVPSVEADIRLGDVVVSRPHKTHGGVVPCDCGKATPSGFERMGSLNTPPTILLNAIAKLRANHLRGKCRVLEYAYKLNRLPTFTREDAGPDILFEADYNHIGGAAYEQCGKGRVVERQSRGNQEIVVHYGTIASGNQVMRDAAERDRVSSELGGVLCFEMEAAGLMNSFPCLVIRGICDYTDSHKNERWQTYAAGAAAAYAKEVLSVISTAEVAKSRTVNEIIREKNALEDTLNCLPYAVEEPRSAQEKAKEFLKMLYIYPYRDRKDRNCERVPDTFEWFTNHFLFQNWNKNQRSSLLWVSADPGCGKSVLVKYLVDHILPSTSKRTTCYFFFKDDFTDQKSAANAVCAILRQISLAKPHLLRDLVLDRFDVDGDKFTQSFHDLWSTLTSVAADRNAGELICILDALDERQDSDRSQLIQAVQSCYVTDSNKSNLKFLLTSRPYDHTQREFRELESHLHTIHLSGEDEVEVEKISREIDLVIQNSVETIGRKRSLEPDERTFLQEQLTLAPNRTYLWVNLTLNVIENISGFTKGNALVAAARPLSLDEMSLAMASEETHRSYDDIIQELEPEERFRGTVRDLCGLFVVIIDAKVYLLHRTAKEFLVRGGSLSSIKDPSRLNSQDSLLKWKNSLRLEESNRMLAERCIWYLTSDFVEIRPGVLLDYSARNWAARFREAGIRSEEAIAALARSPCETGSKGFKAWSTKYISHLYWYPESASSLIIASYFGLDAVVKLLLETKQVAVKSKDEEYGRTPLSWAVWNGHEAVVKLLLETGKAAVESKDKDGGTPLSWAAVNGHEAIVKLLIETGKVAVDSKGASYDRTPLSWAAGNGYEAVVKLLLETGKVAVDSKDNWCSQTPLSRAAKNGHEAVVKLLLETGKVAVGSTDNYGKTPLSQAAWHGHEAVVKLLEKA